jgi:hypothetical protein
MSSLFDEPDARVVAAHTEHAPWAVASEFDGGAVYLFATHDRKICYYKLLPDGRATSDPVEIPGAGTRSGGGAAALANGRLLLAHDADSGLFVRMFDPRL